MQVGVALLIEYTAPVAVITWLWLRHGRAPGRLTIAGAVVALVGLVLVLDLLSGADLSVVGVLWALGAMIGAATYFVMSAEEGNGLPPLALAAGGLITGGVTLLLAGLVGLVPMATSSEAVEFVGATVAWWVPVLALGVITAARRLRDRHRGGSSAGLTAGVVRGAERGGHVAGLRLAAARRAAAPGPAARRRRDPGRCGHGEAGRDRGTAPELTGAPQRTARRATTHGSARHNARLGGVGQRASCRRTKTSLVSMRIAAAVGIASRAPTTPSRAAPTRAAITVTAPGMSTAFDITRG